MVPNSSYQVTSNHNVIQFKIKNSVTTTESQHTAEMNKGSYTFNELASEFIRALNASDASETFTITTSDTTFTYELSWDTSNTILFYGIQVQDIQIDYLEQEIKMKLYIRLSLTHLKM